ncbi:hypothetical protein [Acinetobacter sp. ANC 4640]
MTGSNPELVFLSIALLFGFFRLFISTFQSMPLSVKEKPMVKNVLISFCELIQNGAIGLLVSTIGVPQG